MVRPGRSTDSKVGVRATRRPQGLPVTSRRTRRPYSRCVSRTLQDASTRLPHQLRLRFLRPLRLVRLQRIELIDIVQ